MKRKLKIIAIGVVAYIVLIGLILWSVSSRNAWQEACDAKCSPHKCINVKGHGDLCVYEVPE